MNEKSPHYWQLEDANTFLQFIVIGDQFQFRGYSFIVTQESVKAMKLPDLLRLPVPATNSPPQTVLAPESAGVRELSCSKF